MQNWIKSGISGTRPDGQSSSLLWTLYTKPTVHPFPCNRLGQTTITYFVFLNNFLTYLFFKNPFGPI